MVNRRTLWRPVSAPGSLGFPRPLPLFRSRSRNPACNNRQPSPTDICIVMSVGSVVGGGTEETVVDQVAVTVLDLWRDVLRACRWSVSPPYHSFSAALTLFLGVISGLNGLPKRTVETEREIIRSRSLLRMPRRFKAIGTGCPPNNRARSPPRRPLTAASVAL